MLSLWRRHLKTCPGRSKGRLFTKCACPISCDGEVNGHRVRKSLKTCDWARAGRVAAKEEDAALSNRLRKRVPDATKAFLEQFEVTGSTMRKYARVARYLCEFAESIGSPYVDDLTLDLLDTYRSGRAVCALSWSKELQVLRQFFNFCCDRNWIEGNPAKKLKMPAEPKPKERAPYTSEEITKVIAACNDFGRGPYERLRARAMILLLRFYAPRISDVALLDKARVRLGDATGDAIYFHAQKNGVPVWLPLYPEVKQALDVLPVPRGAGADCPYFFWHGSGSSEYYIKTVARTLEAVFRKSGVANPLIHRFRHTLATEILVKGGSIEDAANVLGDSPETIRRHYAKWSADYQARTIEIMRRVHGTPAARNQNASASTVFSVFKVVAEEGVEPSRPVKNAGF